MKDVGVRKCSDAHRPILQPLALLYDFSGVNTEMYCPLNALPLGRGKIFGQ